MAERYQSRAKKSTKNFEVLGRKELAVSMPLPLGEVGRNCSSRSNT